MSSASLVLRKHPFVETPDSWQRPYSQPKPGLVPPVPYSTPELPASSGFSFVFPKTRSSTSPRKQPEMETEKPQSPFHQDGSQRWARERAAGAGKIILPAWSLGSMLDSSPILHSPGNGMRGATSSTGPMTGATTVVAANEVATIPAPEHATFVASFILAQSCDDAEEIVREVHRDLQDENKIGSKIDVVTMERAVHYIRVSAMTEGAVLETIQSAQRLAVSYLAVDPETRRKTIFLEPACSDATIPFQVAVVLDNATQGPRHRIVREPGIVPALIVERLSNDYMAQIIKAMDKTFERNRGISAVAMRIHLGYYVPFRLGHFTLRSFEEMVVNPRSRGKFIDRLGCGITIQRAMQAMHSDESPLLPLDGRLQTHRSAIPTYSLELCIAGRQVKATLASASNSAVYEATNLKLLDPTDEQTSTLEFISISIGKNTDWKIKAKGRQDGVPLSLPIAQYLKTAAASVGGPAGDFSIYPRVRMSLDPPTGKLDALWVNCMYEYLWKDTGYVIEFTIYRRWCTVEDMMSQVVPCTEFGVVIYQETWDQAGLDTGEDIGGEGSRSDVAGDAARKKRMEACLETVGEIRDFFDGMGVST
ncbi:hypothetical protein F5Y18DRAFT_427398 [Xylariaceae sp. FL1019]|nr:hypothetical protein F5Y18DRAFT_427398 [Xylariaceae sp. FL1019]